MSISITSSQYDCLEEDTTYPHTKICKYTGNISRKSDVLQEQISNGDIFVLTQVYSCESTTTKQWVSVTIKELQELSLQPDSVSVVEQMYNIEHSEHHPSCAYCNQKITEKEETRSVLGTGLLEIHEPCFSELLQSIKSLIQKAKTLISSHTI